MIFFLEEFNKEKSDLTSEIQKLQEELNDAKSQITIAGIKMETDLEEEKRKADEEIKSLQQLVTGIYTIFNIPFSVIQSI